jgi:hypothetical protein
MGARQRPDATGIARPMHNIAGGLIRGRPVDTDFGVETSDAIVHLPLASRVRGCWTYNECRRRRKQAMWTAAPVPPRAALHPCIRKKHAFLLKCAFVQRSASGMSQPEILRHGL